MSHSRGTIATLLAGMAIAFAGGWYGGSLGDDVGARGPASADRQPSSKLGAIPDPQAATPDRSKARANDPDQSPLGDVMAETDWMKRRGDFYSLVAGANLRELEAFEDELGTWNRAGWSVREFVEAIAIRKGALLGEAGLDSMPAESNGRPSFTMKNRIRGWAAANPEAGWEWLQQLEPGRAKDEMLKAWQKGVRKAAPAEIAAVFSKLPNGDRWETIERVLDGAVETQGLTGLGKWYQDSPEEIQKTAFIKIVDRFTQNESEWREAIGFLEEVTTEDSPLFARGLRKMIWRSARSDVGGTLALLENYHDKNSHLAGQKEDFIRETIRTASNTSVNTVGTWLNDNPDSELYDDVARVFVEEIRAVDPTSADEWEATIKNQSTDPGPAGSGE